MRNATKQLRAAEAQPVRSARVGDRLRQAALERVLGRSRELALLERALLDDAAPVVFVHGISGIGKTSLLDVAEARLCSRGARVLRFDGHEIEPTPAGLLGSLSSALGVRGSELADVVDALERAAEPAVVLAIDEYDGLRLIDSWLRRSCVPALPARARVLLLGRSRPVPEWTTTPGWDVLVRSFELGPLDTDGALQLLAHEAVPAELHAAICRLAAGHPLALKLAAVAAAARPDLPLAEVESRHVIGELCRRFMADVRSPVQRSAVEAGSVLRRVNRPLLAAMLGPDAVDAALEALAPLPFVESAADGLVLHQSVRTSVESALRALDPERHRELRGRAWRALRTELDRGSRGRSWQLTADVIYLLDHPQIREAFFPSDTVRYAVEPAAPADRAAVLAIARAHAGATEAKIFERWWELAPSAFQVVRAGAPEVLAFSVFALDTGLPAGLADADPLLARWLAHRERCLPRGGRPVLFGRGMFSARMGVAPCDELSCCYLDIKRCYMQHLDLAAVYVADHGAPSSSFYERIGFQLLPELALDHGKGQRVASVCLRFGDGVLSWISRLIDAQCEQPPEPPVARRSFLLDREARQLLVDGEPKRLTRLEFGVLAHLEHKAGAVASRDELLDAVWGQAHTGSNVVDAVVRSLRKKLGRHGTAIETVTGFGYKLALVNNERS